MRYYTCCSEQLDRPRCRAASRDILLRGSCSCLLPSGSSLLHIRSRAPKTSLCRLCALHARQYPPNRQDHGPSQAYNGYPICLLACRFMCHSVIFTLPVVLYNTAGKRSCPVGEPFVCYRNSCPRSSKSASSDSSGQTVLKSHFVYMRTKAGRTSCFWCQVSVLVRRGEVRPSR